MSEAILPEKSCVAEASRASSTTRARSEVHTASNAVSKGHVCS